MVRNNEKEQLVSYENSIKKSNEFSMAKLNYGLTLNQMQLMAYAIYCTQYKKNTEFHKADFEKKFNIEEYRTEYAAQDSKKLFDLAFSIVDLENNEFDYLRVFQRIKYKSGLFTFTWADDMLPHILNLDNNYNLTDLEIKSKFKSSFSWLLYDHLKGAYGYWHKPFSKEALMKLFCVEGRKTYQNNTGRFKTSVLDIAIAEINEHTEFKVWYREERKGRAIIGFDIHWSKGTTIPSATKKQIRELQTIVDAVFDDTFHYVNLNHERNRHRAIELVREIESYREFTLEPICITSEYASSLIQKGNASLRELESMVEYDRVKPKVDFYNWLEERE